MARRITFAFAAPVWKIPRENLLNMENPTTVSKQMLRRLNTECKSLQDKWEKDMNSHASLHDKTKKAYRNAEKSFEELSEKKIELHSKQLEYLQVGMEVEILYDDGEYYRGKVTWKSHRNDSSVKVRFDSDDEEYDVDLNEDSLCIVELMKDNDSFALEQDGDEAMVTRVGEDDEMPTNNAPQFTSNKRDHSTMEPNTAEVDSFEKQSKVRKVFPSPISALWSNIFGKGSSPAFVSPPYQLD